MKQVTVLDEGRTAQSHTSNILRVSLLLPYPGLQLLAPSVALTLKALPRAVSRLLQRVLILLDILVSFKDFLVAGSKDSMSSQMEPSISECEANDYPMAVAKHRMRNRAVLGSHTSAVLKPWLFGGSG